MLFLARKTDPIWPDDNGRVKLFLNLWSFQSSFVKHKVLIDATWIKLFLLLLWVFRSWICWKRKDKKASQYDSSAKNSSFSSELSDKIVFISKTMSQQLDTECKFVPYLLSRKLTGSDESCTVATHPTPPLHSQNTTHWHLILNAQTLHRNGRTTINLQFDC